MDEVYKNNVHQTCFPQKGLTTGIELYKVTEYNESLEYSINFKASDSGAKLEDLSSKLTGSMIERFPKISIASLSVSDNSFQNAYDLCKKSYLEYSEPLEIINIQADKTKANHIAYNDSSIRISTNRITLSEPNDVKNVIDSTPVYCECYKCMVF